MNSLYKILSKKGRGGDTELRYVNGELAHVNTSESQLIDDYGKAGEAYANNQENSFNETLISRSVGYPLDMGDERYYTWDAQTKLDPVTKKVYSDESMTPPKLTDEQIKDVNMFDQMIFNRELVNKVKRGEL